MSEEAEQTFAEAVTAETGILAPPTSERARFIRFLVTGGLAAGVNVLSRALFQYAVSYEVAVALAYLAGMVAAFILARMFVFDSRAGDARGQFVRFAMVNAVAFVQVWLVSVGLANYLLPAIGWTWRAEMVAHIIGVVSPIATSYFGHKKFSFRD